MNLLVLIEEDIIALEKIFERGTGAENVKISIARHFTLDGVGVKIDESKFLGRINYKDKIVL